MSVDNLEKAFQKWFFIYLSRIEHFVRILFDINGGAVKRNKIWMEVHSEIYSLFTPQSSPCRLISAMTSFSSHLTFESEHGAVWCFFFFFGWQWQTSPTDMWKCHNFFLFSIQKLNEISIVHSLSFSHLCMQDLKSCEMSVRGASRRKDKTKCPLPGFKYAYTKHKYLRIG